MHRVETVTVESSPMEVFLFEPDAAGPKPGIVLAQHIPVGHAGIENDEFTLASAQRFADNGYVVAAPFIFHWWPKEAELQLKREESRDEWMVADIRAAFDLLAGHPDVDADRIGVAGHCWGGRVAWLAACHIEAIRAAAVFYGGRIKIAMGEGNPAPIELAGRISCPVIGLFGNDDQNPTPQDVDAYEAALDDAGVPHEFHRYDGAGHGFQNFPSEDHYRQAHSEDAWDKVLAFFGEHLGS